MHVEAVLWVGWMALPVVAYVGGRYAIGWTNRRVGHGPSMDPEHRLEELRRRMAEGRRTPRGRMAEAVLLAETAGAASSLRSRQL